MKTAEPKLTNFIVSLLSLIAIGFIDVIQDLTWFEGPLLIEGQGKTEVAATLPSISCQRTKGPVNPSHGLTVTRWAADALRAKGAIKPKSRWMLTFELAPPLMGPTMFKGPSMLGRILVVRAILSRATLARWLAPLPMLIAAPFTTSPIAPSLPSLLTM